MKRPNFDLCSALVAFETGELSEDSTVDLFQYLVDSGLAWTLQGHYGRCAYALIDAGIVTPRIAGAQCLN